MRDPLVKIQKFGLLSARLEMRKKFRKICIISTFISGTKIRTRKKKTELKYIV